MRSTTIGTAIDNFTEWYDFGVYSYVVIYISQSFFPGSQLATFAGLAVSFLIRPVGGLFWGFMGDRIGRRGVLAATVLLMAAGTFLLGLIPSYESIGWWAPMLLFLMRAIQGFSTGGEYVGATTFLSEHAPDKKRGHLTSFLPVGTVSGYLLDSLLVTFVAQIGDRIGRRPVLLTGCILMIVVSAPMFLLTSHGSEAAIFFGTLPEGLMLVCFMATVPSTLPSLFPTKVRLGGASVGFNIAVSAFGGTTPLIAATLVETTGNLLVPGYMLIIAGIIGAVSVYYIRETAGTPMLGSGPNVSSENEARELAEAGEY